MITAAPMQGAMLSSTSFAPIRRDFLICLGHKSLPCTGGQNGMA